MQVNLNSYDYVLFAMSGGADSLSMWLYCLELGLDLEKAEFHHHLIDAQGPGFMDWPCTPGYMQALAQAFNVPLYYSWKVDGFKGEMLRENSRTKPTQFQTPEGTIVQTGGTGGKISTRRKFPQVSADLRKRWCSAYLKIDVMDILLCNQERFRNAKTLVITGERWEESTARSKYLEFEPHRADVRDGKHKRHIDHWRPVIGFKQAEVWDIIRRWGVNPHPAYRLGFGRCSCMTCIFASNDQLASVYQIAPEFILRLAHYEEEFGSTIAYDSHAKRQLPIMERVRKGTPYPMQDSDIQAALSETWNEPILLPPTDWTMPLGALSSDLSGPS